MMATKDKRQYRFLQKARHIKRQISIAKSAGLSTLLKEPHRVHKKASLTCGDSNCVMCGNPRKFFGEKTLQELKFECQAVIDERKDPINKWEWEDLNDPKMEW